MTNYWDRQWSIPLLLAVALLPIPRLAFGQNTEKMGVRASAMAGAFVGVADDGSAVFWNPAGIAIGPLLSIAVDGTESDFSPDRSKARFDTPRLVVVSTPPL